MGEYGDETREQRRCAGGYADGIRGAAARCNDATLMTKSTVIASKASEKGVRAEKVDTVAVDNPVVTHVVTSGGLQHDSIVLEGELVNGEHRANMNPDILFGP